MTKKRSFVKERHQIEVISPDPGEVIPFCSHGPCLLFERYVEHGEVEQFFACSVCRDRKLCSFYLRRGDHLVVEKQDRLVKEMRDASSPDHQFLRKRLVQFKELNAENRKLCCDCNVLVLPDEKFHKNHSVQGFLTDDQLLRPSTILSTLNNKHHEAQFWFSNRCVSFLLNLIKAQNYDSVLCVGTPRLHEELVAKRKRVKSFLLDLDYRFAQFWPESQYACYNMCTHYFYTKHGEKCLRRFVGRSKRLLIVTDPPYGTLVDPISASLKKLFALKSDTCIVKSDALEESTEVKAPTGAEAVVDLIWAFPYFMESRIIEHWPNVKMLDYKIDYSNFKSSGKPEISTIRLFTTINEALVVLPETEGYRFCAVCNRYVSKDNIHCSSCNVCPTKHGKTYVHCKRCRRCVKPTYRHCNKCQTCHLANASCLTSKPVCSICGSADHKRKTCPQRASHSIGDDSVVEVEIKPKLEGIVKVPIRSKNSVKRQRTNL